MDASMRIMDNCGSYQSSKGMSSAMAFRKLHNYFHTSLDKAMSLNTETQRDYKILFKP